MDSSKANTGTFYLTIVLVILTIILVVLAFATLGFVYWVWRYPNPAQAPQITGGGVMSSYVWAPIFLAVCLFVVVSLQVLVAHLIRGKNKKRISELNSKLGQETRARQLCVENYQQLEKEKLALSNELALARPSKRLVAIAKNDATDIQDAVIVSGVQFRNEIENHKRYVDFAFAIFNQSVYEISIDDKLGDGDIIFDKQPLVGVKRIEENKAQNVQPRTSSSFMVRQHLDSGDIEAIKNATGDRRFEFHHLKIKIKGGSDFEEIIQEKKLQFDSGLSKEYPTYIYYNGPFRSRFNSSICGRINAVYFKRDFDIDNSIPLKDNRYIFYFILHTYIANHGAPTGIDRFRLVLKANGEPYEAQRLPLTGCRWIRSDAEENLSERDIESENDVTLTDTRRGWLQFVVHGVREIEDESALEIALDVIDKDQDLNRLNSLADSKWIENSMKQESYINGPAIWQQF